MGNVKVARSVLKSKKEEREKREAVAPDVAREVVSKEEAASLFVLTKEVQTPKKFSHVEIRKAETAEIVIPKGMSYSDAVSWLQKMEADEQTDVAFKRQYDFHPDDGAVALGNVLKQIFGWVEMQTHKTFFGDILPELRNIKVGYRETTTAPFNKMGLPGVKGFIWSGAYQEKEDGPFKYQLTGQCWKRDLPKLEFIADCVQTWVDEFSIYRGKAIDSERNFLDVESIDQNALILGSNVMGSVVANIFTPFEKSDACRAAKIPLKRGILLEGPYGCGKTLTAYVTAKRAVEAGWTFILAKSSKFDEVFTFAKQYAPAVVFMEDIDAAVEGQDRTDRINDILNTMDGVLAKDTEIITVLTTNHPEKINKAFLRPGRLDAIIHIGYPEPDAIEALLKRYGGTMLITYEGIEHAVKKCAGMIPAVIREVVERSKLYALSRSTESLDEGGAVSITPADILHSADQMQSHLDLMRGPSEEKRKVRILAEIEGGKVGNGQKDVEFEIEDVNGDMKRVAAPEAKS